jgi:CheY-like chemotaxis protein
MLRGDVRECKRVSKPLILCIDDEELGLRIRSRVLEREGYRVQTAVDGPTGLRIFASERVDVVVLDYAMPVMNGGEVAVEMRRLRPEVPILLLSAYVNLPQEVLHVVDGALVKGDGPNALLGRLRQILALRNASKEALG